MGGLDSQECDRREGECVMAYTFYDMKKINDWMNKKDLPKGTSSANRKAREAFDKLGYLFGRKSAVLFFMLVELDMKNVRQMFNSCCNQKKFCIAVSCMLKDKLITKEWVEAFNSDYKMCVNRLKHINTIIKENLWLTEYYPFFEEYGFNTFTESENYTDEIPFAEQLSEIKTKWESWKSVNADKIEAHLEKAKPDIERHNAAIERRVKARKEEKEQAKLEKQIERQEQREIKKDIKKREAEDRRLEREFARYYK